MDQSRLRKMPSTGLLLAMLAAVIFLAARYYAPSHPRSADQIPGLTYEPRSDRRQHIVALVVTSVQDDGPAARAGIATGDVIDRIDGQPIASVTAVGQSLRRDRAHGITLRVRHAGRKGYKHLLAQRRPKSGRSHVAQNSGGGR